MMATVIRRTIAAVDGMPSVVTDWPASFDDVDKVLGRRADRRRNYALIDGEVCTLHRWSQPCSGCTCDYETIGTLQSIGSGCSECGYTGRSAISMWIPVNKNSADGFEYETA